MPVDAGNIPLVDAEVHEGRHAGFERDDADLDAGVLRPGERIAVLLDLQRWRALVHDREHRNV